MQITSLTSDAISSLLSHLDFNSIISLKKTCRHFNSLFNTHAGIKRKIQQMFIFDHISENPRVIEALSQPGAFDYLVQELIMPAIEQFFKAPQPDDCHIRTVKLTNGAYAGQCLELVCIDRGFEKFHLNLLTYDHMRKHKDNPNYLFIAMNSLYRDLYWAHQITIVNRSAEPVFMLMNMAKKIHPYLYFLGLGAALAKGRVDVFEGMVAEFDTVKDLAQAMCHVRVNAVGRVSISKPNLPEDIVSNEVALSLADIRQWQMWFKSEWDNVPLLDYAKHGNCLEAFEQCLQNLRIDSPATLIPN